MTSSADSRRPVGQTGTAGPRKRVAGARRRSSGTTEASSPTLLLDPLPTADGDPADGRAAAAVPDAAAGDARRAAATEASSTSRSDRAPGARTLARSVATTEPGQRTVPGTSRRGEASEEPVEAARSDEPDEPRTPRVSAGLWASAIGATLALAVLAASLVYALRPTVSDSDRTAAVGSARTTLESLLSYSGSTFDKHVGEVTPELTSPFKDQFTKVAATDIKPMAVKNDATVQAKVYDAGVMDADGDGGDGTTVRVMAFVNQATTTKAQPTPAIDQNRVIATMRKVGDRWLVSELSAY